MTITELKELAYGQMERIGKLKSNDSNFAAELRNAMETQYKLERLLAGLRKYPAMAAANG